MNAYLLVSEQGHALGVFSTRARAESVGVTVPRSRVIVVTVDYPWSQIVAGESFFLVRFPDMRSGSNATTMKIALGTKYREGDYSYDSREGSFRCSVWATSAAAAITEAEVIRAAFASRNP